MKQIEAVIREAMKSVVPSPEEETRMASLVEGLRARVESASRRYREVKGIVVGGSYAKGTWLPRDVDIDIFIKFDPSVDESDFERIGLEIGRKATAGYPAGKKYAQHPYTEAIVDGVKVNVVPCYEVKPKMWKSAADRSPFHVELVSSLPAEKKVEIRLLKRFMKAIGVYGAELETEGFSGYVAEVLVIKHGDFLGVLRHFAEFRPESEDRLYTLPDPVDGSRDLARAISGEKLASMVLASRLFLRSPSAAFFRRLRGRRRPALEKSVIAIVFRHDRLSEDTLWGGLKRTLKHLVVHVESNGFRVARSLAVSDNETESAFLLLPEVSTLPPVCHRVGPPVSLRAESESFLTKNRRRARLLWVGNDARIHLLEERDFTDLKRLLLEMTSGRLESVGASHVIGAGVSRTGRLADGDALSKLATNRRWLREGILEIASDTVGTG